jgi:DNA-binding XRE family transcriptional regulator
VPAKRSSRKPEFQAPGLSWPALAAKCQFPGWDIGRDTVAKIEGQTRWVGDAELVHLARSLAIRSARFFPPRSDGLCGARSPFSETAVRPTEAKLTRALGANIRREWMARGLTQERLAELADLTPRTVQKIEAGTITILVTTLYRLRAAMGCQWRRLLG